MAMRQLVDMAPAAPEMPTVEKQERVRRPVLAIAAGFGAVVVVLGLGTVVLTQDSGESQDAGGSDSATTLLPSPAAIDPSVPPLDPLPQSSTTDVEDSAENLLAVGTLEKGLSCQELASTGYSYAETVAYWTRYETSVALDPDGNGLPCKDEYPAPDVAAVYGAQGALSIHMAVGMFDERVFLATGPAVDAGIICPAGTNERVIDDPEPSRTRASWRWEDIYTCDDGTGTFIVGTDIFIELAVGVFKEYGIWNIVSGTGNYQSLTGGGVSDAGLTVPDTWADSLTGRLTPGYVQP
jgi:hypothetical protein